MTHQGPREVEGAARRPRGLRGVELEPQRHRAPPRHRDLPEDGLERRRVDGLAVHRGQAHALPGADVDRLLARRDGGDLHLLADEPQLETERPVTPELQEVVFPGRVRRRASLRGPRAPPAELPPLPPLAALDLRLATQALLPLPRRGVRLVGVGVKVIKARDSFRRARKTAVIVRIFERIWIESGTE